MIFWKKGKTLQVDCYTYRTEVYNYFPVQKAVKFIPEWFKKLPRPVVTGINDDFQIQAISNLKECFGFTGYFKKGFMLPLWSDLFLDIYPTNESYFKWRFSDGKSFIETHEDSNTGKKFSNEEYQHIKIASPWYFRCDEDVTFLAITPEWYFDKLQDVHILNGVLDFQVNSSNNINMYIKRTDKHKNILLESGTPIYHFIPLTERKVDLKLHLVTKEHFDAIHGTDRRTKFIHQFGQKKKIMKEAGCPFRHKI